MNCHFNNREIERSLCDHCINKLICKNESGGVFQQTGEIYIG